DCIKHLKLFVALKHKFSVSTAISQNFNYNRATGCKVFCKSYFITSKIFNLNYRHTKIVGCKSVIFKRKRGSVTALGFLFFLFYANERQTLIDNHHKNNI